jgi:prepilin-type N-terminal cleavage/methylation domain-containing protein
MSASFGAPIVSSVKAVIQYRDRPISIFLEIDGWELAHLSKRWREKRLDVSSRKTQKIKVFVKQADKPLVRSVYSANLDPAISSPVYRMLRIRQLTFLQPENGFTLVEIIAVLAIIAILASLSIPRFIQLDDNAKQKALQSAFSELNDREKLIWSKIKLSDEGWIDDATLFSKLDTDFGPYFEWAPPADTTGGNLHYQNRQLLLKRNILINDLSKIGESEPSHR